MALNSICIVGRLGVDPEFKTTQGGNDVCTFRMAVNRVKQGEVDWFRVECWGKTAIFCRDFLTKGREVSVAGRMQNNPYEKDGVKRDSWQIVAQNVDFVGPKPADTETPDDAPPPVRTPAAPVSRQPIPAPEDSEIPF